MQFSRTGGCVRALIKGGWGISSFNSLEEIESRIKEALEAARWVGKSSSQLAETKPIEDEVTVTCEEDPRKVSLEEKIKIFSKYNQQILSFDPAIQSSVVFYFDQFKILWFANSLGTNIVQEKVDLAGTLRAVLDKAKFLIIVSSRVM